MLATTRSSISRLVSSRFCCADRSGATHKWTADFDDYYGVEGLIGLAWPRQGEEPPFWMKLLGQWSEKVIGMYLGRAPEGSNSDSPAPGGMVTFG